MLDKEILASLPGIMSEVSTVLFSFDLDRQSFNTPIRVDRTMSAKIVPSTVQKPPPITGQLDYLIVKLFYSNDRIILFDAQIFILVRWSDLGLLKVN